ncbi:MAG: hypothetical protein HQ518_27785 [Rhodopirellula sp.]|nr:hypothetical protein [Rhodopirellula sp.]
MNLTILAAIGLQGNVAFAQVFNGLQQPDRIRSAQGPHYFTIIGHIARPDCYELPTGSPSLVTFVEFAGDLTRTAGGPIHIVRDGRTVQSVFYSNKATLRLTPGDIVVVDGKVNQGRIIHRGTQSTADSETGDVTLAITGLRDYPVVMTIPAERATIRWVTRHLGLDPDAAGFVKVVMQRRLAEILPDSRLDTGTVLAFDPSVVDQSRLPDDLPVPVRAGRQAATATQPLNPIGPFPQQSSAGTPGSQFGAAPGHARVPTIEPTLPNAGSPPGNFNLPSEDQTFVKQLLTDPSSVPLDEPVAVPAGRAFVPLTSTPATSSGGEASHNLAFRGTKSSPEAQRPYQSTVATPEPPQPFGSSRGSLAGSDPQPASAVGSTPASTEDGNDTPRTLPASSSPADDRVLIAPSGSAQADVPRDVPHDHASLPASGDRSQLLPPPPSELNWPVISILTVGLLGAISACFLIYSIANENPAPRVAQIDTSGRYWLDRMIENDIPIEEEPVSYPHNTQLFGKPAPIQRIDAAHNAVPRPHFSAPGGKSGVLKENPEMPDAPSPEFSDSGAPRIVKIHSGRPSQRQRAAAVPAPHSVRMASERHREDSDLPEFAATAVFGDAGQKTDAVETSEATPDKTRRQFRLDRGHQSASAEHRAGESKAAEKVSAESKSIQQTTDQAPARPEFLKHVAGTRSHSAVSRKTVSVQPSPVVVQGANLLDRILSAVDQEKDSALHRTRRRNADVTHQDNRQADERGNS